MVGVRITAEEESLRGERSTLAEGTTDNGGRFCRDYVTKRPPARLRVSLHARVARSALRRSKNRSSPSALRIRWRALTPEASAQSNGQASHRTSSPPHTGVTSSSLSNGVGRSCWEAGPR